MAANHSLCLLNCVEDAKSFLSEFKKCHHEWTVVSTHGAVNDFLTTEGVDCLELSSIISDDFLIKSFRIADVVVKKKLKYLDKLYAPKISKILGIRTIDYFFPLYVYLGKYEYHSILKIEKALGVIFDDNLFKQILVYLPIQQSYFNNGHLFFDIIREISSKYDCSIEIRDNSFIKNKGDRIINTFGKVSKAISNPLKALNWMKGCLNLYFPKKVNCQESLTLLLEPLYDLSFLKDVLKNENVLIWPSGGIPRVVGIEPQMDERFWDSVAFELTFIRRTILAEIPFDAQRLFLKYIIGNFFANLRANLLPVLHLDQLCKQNCIGVALWGNSPDMCSKALIVEYLLRTEVPVVGMQHGGNYVVQNCMDVHFDSDFNNCSHYLSYGFDTNDLQQTYPTKKCKCEIVPVGSYKEHINRKTKVLIEESQPIDILFPMTISLSLFQDVFRINGSQLNAFQRDLIEFLDNFSNIRTCVKPIVGYDDKTCSTIELFKRLKNIQILKNVTFLECFNRFTIKSVVMEFPSTPLFEVIGKEVDIFLLADPILPFSWDALNLLKKRVYFFEDLHELKSSLLKYLVGDLPMLRNNEFYDKYVYRKNTKELILNKIDTLMKQNLKQK